MKGTNKTQETPSEKELHSFGLMMGSVLALFTAVFLYKAVFKAAAIFGAVSLVFFATVIVAPELLRGIHARWMKFAFVLGNFNMKLILSLIYLTGFSVVRFLLLIMRKDPMQRKLDPKTDSYWVDHPEPKEDPHRFEKQY